MYIETADDALAALIALCPELAASSAAALGILRDLEGEKYLQGLAAGAHPEDV
jgi:hypothetical protein